MYKFLVQYLIYFQFAKQLARKSLLVLSCLQYPASLFPPSSTEAEPVSKVSVLVLQLDIKIKFTEGNRN